MDDLSSVSWYSDIPYFLRKSYSIVFFSMNKIIGYPCYFINHLLLYFACSSRISASRSCRWDWKLWTLWWNVKLRNCGRGTRQRGNPSWMLWTPKSAGSRTSDKGCSVHKNLIHTWTWVLFRNFSIQTCGHLTQMLFPTKLWTCVLSLHRH